MEVQKTHHDYNVILNKKWKQEPKCDIYIIRHGVSIANLAEKQMQYDQSLIDCSLHAWGFQQAESLQANCAKLDIQVVFVSPLRRTLQTAATVFKTHPKKKEIKFIVFPWAVESLGQVDDIPFKTIELLKKEFSQQDGMIFDFSMVETQFAIPALWRYYLLSDQSLLERFEQMYNDWKQKGSLAGFQEQLTEQVIEEMKRIDPKSLESTPDVYNRAIGSQKLINAYLQKYELQGQGQVVLVAHNHFNRLFTCTGFKNSGKRLSEYLNAVDMDNCDVHPFIFPKL